jgi:hypothetical protein
MKKLILEFLILSSLTSCSLLFSHKAPKYIKEGFNFCYNGQPTGIDSIINIDGYYSITNTFNEPVFSNSFNREIIEYELDSLNGYLMFFEDGTFISGFHDTNPERINKTKSNMSEYMHEITENNNLGVSSYFYEGFSWGRYYISCDTIKGQHVKRPIKGSTNSFWYAYEVWFKVIDRNTIIEIYRKPIHIMTDSDWNNFQHGQKKRLTNPAKFFPVKEIPNSNGWIKYEKWFWCDENEWSTFMEKRK